MPSLQVRFRGAELKDNLQLGCMTPNGSEHVIHDLSLHMELHPMHTLLHIDVTNAFNTQHRYAFLKEVHTHFPALLPLCEQFYTHESDLIIMGKDGKVCVLKSRSGQQQGDTLGSFLFCLGIHPILEEAHRRWPHLLIRAICDDIHVAGEDAQVAAAFDFLRRELATIGLHVKYGPKKTCCYVPGLPAGDDAATAARRAALGASASALPAEVVRLGGGMAVLGSFVGTDEWVRDALLRKVEDANDDRSIRYPCEELKRLAASDARNARDIAGALLRTCVIPRTGYLCRTVRPDLLLPAARAVDDMIAHTLCAVFHIDPAIFTAAATSEQRLAAVRARLPTSLQGAGLRSMVTTSQAAYVASLRAVAPSIAAGSSPAVRAALRSLSPATLSDAAAAPSLRAAVDASMAVVAVMPAEDKPLLALDKFCEPPKGTGLQRRITHAVEAAVHARAVADARPNEVLRAFLHSCDGRWVRTMRVAWLQLSNEETVVRMQRYLRQPLSVLAGIVGCPGLDTPPTIIDRYGDGLLSGYKAPEDNEWNVLHHALCRLLAYFGRQAHASVTLEGGKIRGTRKRPGDARFAGDAGTHGWVAAGTRELWTDATCVCPVLPTYVHAAAARRGAAAATASTHKHTKYRRDIPGHVFFLPLAFETEGFHTPDLEKLLVGLARKRAEADGLEGVELKTRVKIWTDFWLDQFAITHARYVARCLLHRAAAVTDASGASFPRASLVDVLSTRSVLPPMSAPPPPPPPLPGTASNAAAAPA